MDCDEDPEKNFKVTGSDPHGFDADNDGIGCEGNPPPPPPPHCDPSYPDFCIPSPPPDLDCDEVPEKNFKVTGSDPHGFDADNDGIGCEGNPPPPPPPHCDPSYPDFCIPSPPPDLDCDEVREKNFKVTGSDPHGFDADNDGIGCESTKSATKKSMEDNPVDLALNITEQEEDFDKPEEVDAFTCESDVDCADRSECQSNDCVDTQIVAKSDKETDDETSTPDSGIDQSKSEDETSTPDSGIDQSKSEDVDYYLR